MSATTVTQTQFIVNAPPAQLVRCRVLDAVCVLPRSVLRDLADWSDYIEQARDQFADACTAQDARAIADTFETLSNTIVTAHTKQLQAVQAYGVR